MNTAPLLLLPFTVAADAAPPFARDYEAVKLGGGGSARRIHRQMMTTKARRQILV